MRTHIAYRPEIDGLRAIAVTAVILFHAGFVKISGGFIGVDVFFVISGYLITGIIWRELLNDDFSISRFYARRAKRIIPALFLVLTTTSIFAYLWMLPSQLEDFSESLLASLGFSANIYFWQHINYFSANAVELPLLHLWSLGVEEQFYLLFPLLLMVIAKYWKSSLLPILGCIFVASLILAHWGATHNPAANFYLLPSRSWELLMGSMLAVAPQSLLDRIKAAPWLAETLAATGLILVTVPILFFDNDIPTPSLYLLPSVLGAGLILAFASQSNLTGKMLSIGVMRLIGLISYSAYLWHQPVIAFTKLQPYTDSRLRVLAVILSFALALASWWFVERPFRAAAPIKTTLKSSAIGLVAAAVAASALLFLASAWPQFVPTYEKGVRMAGLEVVTNAASHSPDLGCDEHLLKSDGIVSCSIGVARPRPDLIVWGDSLTGALRSGLDQAMKESGLSGMAYYINGCPPVVGLTRASTPGCDGSGHAAILEKIMRTPGHPVVLIYGNLPGAYAPGIRLDADDASRASIITRFRA